MSRDPHDTPLVRTILWVALIFAMVGLVNALVGCAPRYRADDPSIFGRPEVLDQVAK